ncbi:MAG: FAD-dependent oxidoreductase [Candidatus Woesearchaeota archaeon]
MNTVLIIGSGIAGSSLAYQLGKRDISYVHVCDTRNPLANTSSKSYGHCRIVKKPEQLYEFSQQSLNCSKNELSYYKDSPLVEKFFEELDIDFLTKSFGIIPKEQKPRGGHLILKRLQQQIRPIHTDNHIISVQEFSHHAQATTENTLYEAEYIVLAIGGFAPYLHLSDAVKYQGDELFTASDSSVEHRDSFFIHPFGYLNGRDVLTGKEVQRGIFKTRTGEQFFSSELEKHLRADTYHEIFPKIVEQMNARECFFTSKHFNGGKPLEVRPVFHYTSGGFRTDPNHLIVPHKRIFSLGECEVDGSKNGGRLPGMPFTKSIIGAIHVANYIYHQRHMQCDTHGTDRNS